MTPAGGTGGTTVARGDTGQYIGLGLTSLLQGYMQGRKQARDFDLENQKLDLLKGKTGLETAKLKADLASEGFTPTGDIDPGYYTPPNAASPQAMESLGMAETAAGLVDPISAAAAADARSQVVPAPQGNPSWLRAQRAAELKRSQLAGGMRGGVEETLSNILTAKKALSSGEIPTGAENLRLKAGFSNLYNPGSPTAAMSPQDLEALGILPPGSAARLGAQSIPNAVVPHLKTKPLPPPKPGPLKADPGLIKQFQKYYPGSDATNLTPKELIDAIDKAKRSAAIKDKNTKGADKATAAAKMEQQTADIVSDKIRQALDLVENDYFASGQLVGLGKVLPLTSSKRLDDILATIRANIGFAKLQQMRQASPTGGALGAVSDFETKMLQESAGKIVPNMNTEDLKNNLKDLLEQYGRVIHGNASDQRFSRSMGGKRPPPAGEVREYSPSRKQTRVLRNGKLVQVLDGDQR